MKPGRWSLIVALAFIGNGVLAWVKGDIALWFAIFCCFALAFRNFQDAVEEWQ